MTTVRWVIELDAADAARLAAKNEAGHQFTLRCGSQQAVPAGVTEAEVPS